jgi:hypothetical protein
MLVFGVSAHTHRMSVFQHWVFVDDLWQVDWDHMDQAQTPKIVSSWGARNMIDMGMRLEMVGMEWLEMFGDIWGCFMEIEIVLFRFFLVFTVFTYFFFLALLKSISLGSGTGFHRQWLRESDHDFHLYFHFFHFVV